MDEALNKACILVENQAKENCPVDTGELRMSITHYVEGQTGIVGTNKHYAPYVEYGTGIHARDGNGRQTPWKTYLVFCIVVKMPKVNGIQQQDKSHNPFQNLPYWIMRRTQLRFSKKQ